jgi:hypothetical protein
MDIGQAFEAINRHDSGDVPSGTSRNPVLSKNMS